MLRGLAERIAANRTVAGVHYPIDSWAGAALGTVIGRAVLARCGITVPFPSLEYIAQDDDFFDHDFADPGIAATKGLTEGTVIALASSPTYCWLWGRAADEAQKG
jgi:membrane-associated phospholipid phosphatase